MQRRYLILLISALVIAVGVLAWANMRQMSIVGDSELAVKVAGQDVGSVDLDQIRALGQETFETTLRSSGMPPRGITYTGVPLRRVISGLVDDDVLAGADQLVARALDGYVVAFAIGELMVSDHLYVVFEQDGKPLGSKSDGGWGPLLLVARQDEFGQRWCKFMIEVDIQ